MIELVRIVENQSALSSYRATQNEELALQLELLIEKTKPKNRYVEWHPLIATPFRYSPPHPEARFRPPYGRNVFYGSLTDETALYEHAYHFIKQRKHLKIKTDEDIRSMFFVDADESGAITIKNHKDCANIIDKNNYDASHQFIHEHPDAKFIIYPSCRDPKQRENAAVFEINYLAKNPTSEAVIKYFYDNKKQQITWIDYGLHIGWKDVV